MSEVPLYRRVHVLKGEACGEMPLRETKGKDVRGYLQGLERLKSRRACSLHLIKSFTGHSWTKSVTLRLEPECAYSRGTPGVSYRGTSHIKTSAPLAPHGRTVPGAL